MITYREQKGSPLTNDEIDENFRTLSEGIQTTSTAPKGIFRDQGEHDPAVEYAKFDLVASSGNFYFAAVDIPSNGNQPGDGSGSWALLGTPS